MEKEVIVKTIKKSFNDKIKAGISWFKFVSAINNIKLTKRELELLSFINSRGTISSSSSKQEFCRLFDSSPGTITNMTSKLIKPEYGVLVKEKSKIRIHPALRVDFDKEFVVRFFINVNEPKPIENQNISEDGD